MSIAATPTRCRLARWLMLLCGFSAGCMSGPDGGNEHDTVARQIEICHGYSCKYTSKLPLGSADAHRFAAILASGQKSPPAERAAIGRAVSYFEDRTFDVIGIRDSPKSKFGAFGVRGQMDCIDESTNTRALLLYLEDLNLLRHHTVTRNASRGMLIDGRYFHNTAVVRESSGVKWAVDSWYAPMGSNPDILLLSDWMARGFWFRSSPP